MARKATFIGSELWKSRDVSKHYDSLAGRGRIIDKPSGIWLQATARYAESNDVFAELAHRVLQLT